MYYLFKRLDKADLNDAVVIFQAAFLQSPWNEEWTKQQAYNRLIDYMETKMGLHLGIFVEQRLVGFIFSRKMTYLESYELWIDEICVDPTYQGKSIGSALMNKLKEICLNEHIERICLVTKRGKLSHGFYYKMGFDEDESSVCLIHQLDKK